MPTDMKKIIADTFLKMIEHGNIDKITVKALIEECHISRQTFYYHFQDLMDVLEWSVNQGMKKLVEESLKAPDMRSALRVFVTFAAENYSGLRKLMDSQRRAGIEKLLIEAVETYLKEMISGRQPELYGNYSDMDVLLRFYACGLVGILIFCGGRPHLDQERLVLQLEQILS